MKKNNEFLIRANEELRVERKKAEDKLEGARQLLNKKEDMLNTEFERLGEQMQQIRA